ncbi:hypothetical protein L249_8423 [Ophiocordyceps polyrhachis-furcata BCC 54312]|uniref:Uncharacterized protein n=1 Tax=Ophiocordyceps polyrhachis-furcata BCC 54312 TaxID=1330021 RepID=A0A367L6P3_9HYPO|nr:hypothetical protein L249_8423 [Ophiocordyceps polyrhachis-furcata BCC 54312]
MTFSFPARSHMICALSCMHAWELTQRNIHTWLLRGMKMMMKMMMMMMTIMMIMSFCSSKNETLLHAVLRLDNVASKLTRNEDIQLNQLQMTQQFEKAVALLWLEKLGTSVYFPQVASSPFAHGKRDNFCEGGKPC